QVPAELAVEPQLVDAVVAVCRKSHQLAGRTIAGGEALGRETLVLLPRELAPAVWSLVHGSFAVLRGVRTADLRQEPSFPAIIRPVRREGAIGLVPACVTGALGCEDVVHRPCDRPELRLTLWLAWRRQEESPLRESFVELCRSLRKMGPSALAAS